MKLESAERHTCSYENTSKRFLFSRKRKLDLQYSQLYVVRLREMRKRLIVTAHKKWGDNVKVHQLSEIKQDEHCVIIGTMFRKMELQPSILKEISYEVYLLIICLTDKGKFGIMHIRSALLLLKLFFQYFQKIFRHPPVSCFFNKKETILKPSD